MSVGTNILAGPTALPTSDPADLDALLTPEQAAAMMHTSAQALACQRLRAKTGGFAIPWTKLGSRVFYLRRDLLEAVRANRHTSGEV